MQVRKKISFLIKLDFIKSIYYSFMYKSKILIGYGCRLNIHGKGKILVSNGVLYLGMGITKPERTVIDIYDNAILNIRGNVKIHNGCKIVVYQNAKLEINDGTFINESSRVYCRKNIYIGKDCAISWNVNIMDTDVHTLTKNGEIINPDQPVRINDNVWIGLNVTVLKGVIIESNTVIAASSLVIKKCDNNSIYGGLPARKIESNIDWVK